MAALNGTPSPEAGLDVATTGVSYLRGVTGAGASVQISIADAFTNYVEPTSMDFNAATRMFMASGSSAVPDNSKQPIDWMQKHTAYDSGTDLYAHRPASGREILVYGSGATGSTNTDGTWIGFLGNAAMLGENQGTDGSPDYDARGNMIGIAGFARSEKPSDGIVCGVWGYGSTPNMNSTEWAAWATNFSTVGMETNIDIRHPDPGAKTVVSGKGTTIGWYAFNYQAPGGGKKDMSFAFALAGNPDDDNWSSTDIDNWNGYYVGGLIDKVKTTGLLFGQYFKSGATGIKFSSLVGSQELAAAIDLGPNKLQMGEYVGATFNAQDLWHSGGNIWFRYGGTSRRLLQSNSAVVTVDADTIFSVNGGYNTEFSTVNNPVNYFRNYNAATGGAPAITAVGNDTNINLELRAKGSGRIFTTAPIMFRPGSSVSPTNNGDVVFELTSNTHLTVKAKGSDGTTRTNVLTLS